MKTFSLHKIRDRDQLGFSDIEYSKFKFGDKDVARSFGYALARGFIQSELVPIDRQIVVVSSPYCFIPTATFALKDYFIQRLNDYLVDIGQQVVQETKIYRTITYKEDYGGLSADERMSLIQNDGFHIDKSFLAGKHILFLDDVKITGSHERVIQRMVDEYGIDCEYTYMYFAELINKDIHPSIENDLNYAFVKSLLDLDKIIKNENFLLNTRTVKYILKSPKQEFRTFIQYQSIRFTTNLFHQAIGNSYHLIDEYASNLSFIKELIS